VDTGRPAGNGSASSFRAYGILGLVLEPDPDRATRPLTTEESDLAAHYHGWLPMVAQSLRLEYPSISLSDDDLVDAAYEAFIERVKAWDPRKGLPFIQFANLRIRGAMLDAARAANPHIERQRFHERKAAAGEKLPELTARPARTYDPATQDEPDWLQRLRDDTSTLRTKLARREQEALLRQAISELPALEQDIIVALTYDDLTQRQAAQRLNTSQPTLHRKAGLAHKRLRALLKRKGITRA
jgi:RNA polymerase sigma factor for flagellar operon FliA